jgi:hypothetical protein
MIPPFHPAPRRLWAQLRNDAPMILLEDSAHNGMTEKAVRSVTGQMGDGWRWWFEGHADRRHPNPPSATAEPAC